MYVCMYVCMYVVSAKYKQRPKKACRSSPQHSSTPIFCSRCTRILSPTPPQDSSTSSDDSIVMADIRKYSTDVQVINTLVQWGRLVM